MLQRFELQYDMGQNLVNHFNVECFIENKDLLNFQSKVIYPVMDYAFTNLCIVFFYMDVSQPTVHAFNTQHGRYFCILMVLIDLNSRYGKWLYLYIIHRFYLYIYKNFRQSIPLPLILGHMAHIHILLLLFINFNMPQKGKVRYNQIFVLNIEIFKYSLRQKLISYILLLKSTSQSTLDLIYYFFSRFHFFCCALYQIFSLSTYIWSSSKKNDCKSNMQV